MNKKHLSNRRNFLRTIGATTVIAGAVGVEPFLQPEQSHAHAAPANRGINQRTNECAKFRRDAAQTGLPNMPQNLQHPSNLDEELYSNKIGNYLEGLLPHNNYGTVVPTAYNALTTAVKSGEPDDFNAIPIGNRRLTNPQPRLAIDLEGPDVHALVSAYASREIAAEISENY